MRANATHHSAVRVEFREKFDRTEESRTGDDGLASQVEFAAAHKKLATRIRADETTFLIDQFCVANRAALPPVIQLIVFVF